MTYLQEKNRLNAMNSFRFQEIKLRGEITPPGSKSIIQRVLLISTFLDRSITLKGISDCEDVSKMQESLVDLGCIVIPGKNFITIKPPERLNNIINAKIKDSATALRFLVVRLATYPGIKSFISMSRQLAGRPLDPLLNVLKKCGSEITRRKNKIEIIGHKFNCQEISIDAGISSQFISAFLLTSPWFDNGIRIIPKQVPVSRLYLQLTCEIMKEFGINVIKKNGEWLVPAGSKYRNLTNYDIEPDASSACYFWALGALTGSEISVKGLAPDSFQPDIAFLDILGKMGAEINISEESIKVMKGKLKGIKTDLSNLPDQVPTLAFLALFADSPTTIRNIRHLKYKESNRIDVLIREFKKLGARIVYEMGDLCVEPLRKKPAKVTLKTDHDHRLAMIFYLLKLLYPDLEIDDLDCINKSYPEFIRDIGKLKGV